MVPLPNSYIPKASIVKKYLEEISLGGNIHVPNPSSGILTVALLEVMIDTLDRLLLPAMTTVAVAGRLVVWTVLRLIPSSGAFVPIPEFLPAREAKLSFPTLMALTFIRTSSLTLLLSTRFIVRRSLGIRAMALLNGVQMALLAGLTL